MRKIIEAQMQFGQVDISEIEFDLRSRDEIPKLLMGLQHIYCTPEARMQTTADRGCCCGKSLFLAS